MYFLYSLVLSLLFLALLPYFLFQSLRHGKYASSFKQRIGWLPESLCSDGRQTIWVHAVSVGEFLATRPLIDALKSELPNCRIVVSTTTLTGQALARSEAESIDGVFYFPFDWRFAVRRALTCVKPSIVIIVETELWPNFIRECRRRGVVTVLANGRVSPASFRRYLRVRWFMRRVMDDFSLMVMQSEADAGRALQLGAPSGRVRVCGNLKYDQAGAGNWGLGVGAENDANPQPPASNPREEIDRRFGLSSSAHLIVAGSTVPGEEEMLLASLREVRSHPGLEDTRLLIAPRHPERFDEVALLIGRSGFSVARRSSPGEFPGSTAQPTAENDGVTPATVVRRADVILLDTIGELASVYSFAAVVFVGGSLVRRGGHNILEPAAFARPVIVGPHTENFHQMVSDFARAGAVVQIAATAENTSSVLTRELIRLLSDREEALAMGKRAREILLAGRGAAACTIAAIKDVMGLGA